MWNSNPLSLVYETSAYNPLSFPPLFLLWIKFTLHVALSRVHYTGCKLSFSYVLLKKIRRPCFLRLGLSYLFLYSAIGQIQHSRISFIGPRDRNRTGTLSLARDFKSLHTTMVFTTISLWEMFVVWTIPLSSALSVKIGNYSLCTSLFQGFAQDWHQHYLLSFPWIYTILLWYFYHRTQKNYVYQFHHSGIIYNLVTITLLFS